MKILFCPAHYIFDETSSASEPSWAFNIANGVATKFPQSVVVTGFARLKSPKPYELIELQPHKTLSDIRILNALKFNFLYTLESLRQLKGGFDLFHHVLPFMINSTFNLSAGIIRKQGIPLVIGPLQTTNLVYDDSYSSGPIHHPPRPKTIKESSLLQWILAPMLTMLSRRTLKSADLLIAVNSASRELLLKNDISSEKILIIPPGIATSSFYPPAKLRESGPFKILTTAPIITRKGVDLILRAIAALVYEHNLPVHLTVVGDGPQTTNLKNLANTLQINHYVAFVGKVSNAKIHRYYQASDLFVSMSRSDSWGQMYLEAMASGLPIVSARNDGSVAIIKDNEFGFLVDQEDYQSAADKIRYLVDNPAILKKFAARARSEAVQRYDWESVIVPKYLRVYRSMKI